MLEPRWIVIKFGGTSVSNRACWLQIEKIIRSKRQQGLSVLLVCSAAARVSNWLDRSWQQAARGEDFNVSLEAIEHIYRSLSEEMSVDFDEVLGHYWQQLQRLLSGIALLSSASPVTQAQVMATGELMLTGLGQAFLQQQGLSSLWLDARTVLKARASNSSDVKRAYLNAQCGYEFDPDLVRQFNADLHDVVVTQGFIASNQDNETVLLGRGGSDISAGYFAAKIAAVRCEIWTDVPGIYTANPHMIAQARHLVHLTYDEAQEIASMGAKVLHPRVIMPLQSADIPLSIRYTQDTEREGTTVEKKTNSPPAIKSVLVKNDVVLLSIEAIAMWHQAGFLADIFHCFKQQGVSIDLISTSQTNVTVSLDCSLGLLDQAMIDALISDLEHFARVEMIAPCAVISLVGCRIRKILHQVSEVFPIFRSEEVFLLSQAANDLNFAFVVEQSQADRIAQLIHEIIIQHSITHPCFGLSYDHEFHPPQPVVSPWWQLQADRLLQKAQDKTPVYLYNQTHLQETIVQLKACDAIDRLFYAIKANSNVQVLQLMFDHGLGFECVSIYEVEHVLNCFADIDPQRILFTPNFAHKSEYQRAFEYGVIVTIDNLHPLTQWPDVFSGRRVLLRIDPGFGLGHHQYVETGGTHSKFGIPVNDLDRVRVLTEQYGIKVIGLHAHSGSGIMKAENWSNLADKLTHLVSWFPEVEILDLGGGLGVPEKSHQQSLDLQALNASLAAVKQKYPQFQLWLEPGRYLTAQSGVILTRVTQMKTKGLLQYIGVDAGMHTLIRPALYGAYHAVVNLSKLDQPAAYLAHIVGPICESGDVLARSRWMPKTEEGDVLLIANTGAYGACMSMSYNLRPKAEELMFL